jgi:hypothetical protein
MRVMPLVVLAMVLAAMGQSTTTTQSVDAGPASRQFPSQAEAIRSTLETMSELATHDSEELVMAWNNLYDDLISLSSDLERDATRLDLDGVVRRIESFRERFDSAEPVSEFDSEWEQLISNFIDAHDLAERQTHEAEKIS